MGAPRIIVVEDESIIALDIRLSLEALGYDVVYVAASGEEVLKKAPDLMPDLMLMDIRLRGGIDGVETALHLGERFDIPVIFLSGHTDAETLERVKMTQPFGYLSKPFTKKDLRTTIEVALHRHEMEKQLREREQWLSVTLRSIGDAVIATDADGKVLFMNPVAQTLTGWPEIEAMGLALKEVFPLVTREGKEVNPQWLTLGMSARRTFEVLDDVYLMTRGGGKKIPIEDSIAPMRGLDGRLNGAVVVFRDATPRKAQNLIKPQDRDVRQADSDGEMNRLAVGIAHDFNDKLTVILGMSELLATGVSGNAGLTAMTNEIRQVCDDSIVLTRRLLAMSRNAAMPVSDRQLNEVVRNLEKNLRPLLGDLIGVESRLDPALEAIESDPGFVEHLVMNLIMHARDGMGKAGLLVLGTRLEDLRSAHPDMAFPFEPGRYAILRVCHTAAPGSSVSTTMNPSLAIVYGSMKLNGGNIRLETEGEEESVYIYLPINAEERVEPMVSLPA